MIMTNDDIVKEYLEAKNRMAQIGILADQNLCKKKDIVAVLMEAGVDVPKQFLPKKAAPEAPAVAAPATPYFTESLRLAAMETIEKMLPSEECSGGEALTFISKVHAILGFMEAVSK